MLNICKLNFLFYPLGGVLFVAQLKWKCHFLCEYDIRLLKIRKTNLNSKDMAEYDNAQQYQKIFVMNLMTLIAYYKMK